MKIWTWVNFGSRQGDIFVMGDLSWAISPPQDWKKNYGRFNLDQFMPLPRNEKVGFWWILGQGYILVMGDLSWVMYLPPIGNFLWQILFNQFMPPPPRNEKVGFQVKVIFW